jgi:hypothetical protein
VKIAMLRVFKRDDYPVLQIGAIAKVKPSGENR